jgi:hypothetical protein
VAESAQAHAARLGAMLVASEPMPELAQPALKARKTSQKAPRTVAARRKA